MKFSAKHLLLPATLCILTASAILSSLLRMSSAMGIGELDPNSLNAIDIRYLHEAPNRTPYPAGARFSADRTTAIHGYLRHREPGLHRSLGRLFIVSGLISCVSIPWLSASLPAMGGMASLAGSWFFAAAMMAFLVIAYRAIRRRDYIRHRSFMIRAYAIGSAVATTRLLAVLGEYFLSLDLPTYFATFLWLAMLTHVATAGLILEGQCNLRARAVPQIGWTAGEFQQGPYPTHR